MFRSFIVLLIILTGCSANNTRPGDIDPLSDYDYKIITCLAENAFFEAYSENHDDIAVQIHSVINRSERLHDGDIIATVEEPWAYSWKKLFSKQRQERVMEANYERFQEILSITIGIYKDHLNGERFNSKINENIDHYITVDLAKTDPPYWFKYYCINKMRIGSHVYCEGVAKVNGK